MQITPQLFKPLGHVRDGDWEIILTFVCRYFKCKFHSKRVLKLKILKFRINYWQAPAPDHRHITHSSLASVEIVFITFNMQTLATATPMPSIQTKSNWETLNWIWNIYMQQICRAQVIFRLYSHVILDQKIIRSQNLGLD